VLFLDGDCLPAPDLVQVHATSAHKGDLVIGYFVPLDEETTAALEESSLALSLPPEQRTLLKQRQRRARRQLFLRRLGLTKSHKPKAVTGNLSVRLERISEVNGFDEAYMEWGFEDDDFARRLHATGARSVLAHAEALVYHQWHPSLKSGDWTHTSSARRFRTSTPKRCVRGLDHPIEQHTVSTMRFGC
jgi:GT2 family glycosyltransferase